MDAVREPAVAGTFYTADPVALAKSVDQMLDAAATSGSPPKAVIAPHAGHIYSGPVAASVYASLKNAADRINRVVLLGPSHRVGFRGIAATSATTYRTPLGDIPIDTQSIQQALTRPSVGFLDEAHAQEHSLEVHLPFLQRTLGDFQLVPLVVGDAGATDVADILELLWGGPETLVVISSDLSHYHSYNEARQIDTRTCERIVALDDCLVGEEACGYRPINGLLTLAKRRGLAIEQIDLRNSGDTAGDKSRVVGYGAFAVHEHPRLGSELLPAWRQRLLQVAREAILQPLLGKGSYSIDPASFPAALRAQRASFVTINRSGHLRGCIGSLTAHRELVVDVLNNAQAAAFQDPRFKPLSLEEYQDIDVHISVLSVPEPVTVADRETLEGQLRPGIDGLIIDDGGRRATYLPSVWEQIADPTGFVGELRRKAGLPREGWSKTIKVWRYQTEEFS